MKLIVVAVIRPRCTKLQVAIPAKLAKSLSIGWHEAGKVVNAKAPPGIHLGPDFPCRELSDRVSDGARGNFKSVKAKTKERRSSGLGQLTLVEHALCPLDPRVSLVENLVHDVEFFLFDKHRRRQTAKARV